jgi:hypothetical protein
MDGGAAMSRATQGHIQIELERASYDKLRAYLAGKPAQIARVLMLSINETLDQQKTRVGQRIREIINIRQRDITPHIRVVRRANKKHTSGTLRISESKRLNLAKFDARQTKKGITAKIFKFGERRLYPGTFGLNIDKLNNRIYRRSGTKRLPIESVNVLSPWGAYVKNPYIDQETLRDSQAMLSKNINRHLRFVLLKEAGAI